MKSMSRIVIATAAVAVMAVSGYASLGQYSDWAKGPVQWIMTKDESQQWKSVKNEEEAKKFIDLFWARRDPTPSTPINEYKDDFDARVEYADGHFAQGRTKGSLTDRGHVFIVMGSPSRLQRSSTEAFTPSLPCLSAFVSASWTIR